MRSMETTRIPSEKLLEGKPSPEWLMLIAVGELPNTPDRKLTIHDQEAYEIVWPRPVFEREMKMITYPGVVMEQKLDDVALTIREPGPPVEITSLSGSWYRHYEKRFNDGVLWIIVKVINNDKKYGVIQAVVPLLREGK